MERPDLPPSERDRAEMRASHVTKACHRRWARSTRRKVAGGIGRLLLEVTPLVDEVSFVGSGGQGEH
jgi:hypothetical protein